IFCSGVFIVFVSDVCISSNSSPDDLTEMVSVISVRSSSHQQVPASIIRDIIEGKNATVEVIVQPSPSDDIGAFNGLISDTNRGQVVVLQIIIFPELFIISLSNCIVQRTVYFPIIS